MTDDIRNPADHGLIHALRDATFRCRQADIVKQTLIDRAIAAGLPAAVVGEAAGVSAQALYMRRWRAKQRAAPGDSPNPFTE